jgi:hypothetical protein
VISGRLAEIGEYPDADDIRVGVEAAEQFHGHIALRVEQTEQHVLHTDVLIAESESLAPGTFESTFGPRHHRKMPGHVRLFASAPPPPSLAPRPLARNVQTEPGIIERTWPEASVHPPAHLIEVDPQGAQRVGVAYAQATVAHHLAQGGTTAVEGDAKVGQHAHPGRLWLGEDAEQEMLGAEPGMPERSGLFLSANDNPAGRIREPLEHRHRRPCFLCTACLLTPSA